MIVVLAGINIVGVKESTGVNVLLAVIDFMTQLLLVVVGAVLVLSPEVLVDNVELGIAPTWKDFILAIPIGMLAYTGIETISNMSEEARDEATTIPAAISRVRIAVFAIYFTLPAVALSALPVQQRADGTYYTLLGLPEEEGGYAGDPILGFVKQMDLGPLQGPGELYVGLLAATILFLATNAGIIGVSRLVYSMGIHRQMPDGLRQLHPHFRTPYIGILVFSGLAILILLPGQETFLGSIYSFGALLSFTIAHASVIRLRRKLPDFPRSYRGPGNLQIGGFDAPLFAIAGGTFTAVAFVVIAALNLPVAAFGVGWLAFGVLVYAAFRRRHGLDMTSTYKVAIPQPVVDHEAEYDSVLVPVSDGYDDHVMATATKLAARKRRGMHVVSFVTVPYALPIDAPMREAEADAQSVIEQARVQGGRRVLGPRRADPARPGGAADRRGGDRHARGRDRARAAAAGRRRLAVRQDARDGARRAPVPGRDRVGAGAGVPRQAPRGARAGAGGPVKALTRLTSFLLVFLGVGIMVRTVDAGGGATAFGILVGLLFVAAGAGRLYLTREPRDPEEPR